MKENAYRPEGIPCKSDEIYLESIGGLEKAMKEGRILQARCHMCDAAHNLHVNICGKDTIIMREEAALGVKEGSVKDVAILTRVNKMICFKVIDIIQDENGKACPVLSRAAAQKECKEHLLYTLSIGDIIPAKITHLEQFGAFADIGCGLISMIAIDNISVSRIRHPKDRFTVGMDVLSVVRDIDKESGRITLSHKELLGTWLQNADCFEAGQTVSGIVRSAESYGIFIELTPNLAGLAEYSGDVMPGQSAGVYIKSILPDKMKIKLAVVDVGQPPEAPQKIDYYISEGHIDRWRYSPDSCNKVIETVFTAAESQVI